MAFLVTHIIKYSFWVGQYISSRPGTPCSNWIFPVLPSQSCNNYIWNYGGWNSDPEVKGWEVYVYLRPNAINIKFYAGASKGGE